MERKRGGGTNVLENVEDCRDQVVSADKCSWLAAERSTE